jgi:transcriptional regulator with XRE-family HTH domain
MSKADEMKKTGRPGSRADGEKLMAIAPTIGARVRDARVAHRVQQTELAKELGTSKHSISRLERGATGPTLGRLARIADILGEPLSRFFSDPEEESGYVAVRLLTRLIDETPPNKWPGILAVVKGLCQMEGIEVDEAGPGTQEAEPPKRIRKPIGGKSLEEMRDLLRSGALFFTLAA